MATVNINDASNYSFEVRGDRIVLHGPFAGYLSDETLVCTKEQPTITLGTGNVSHQILRLHLHRLRGARMVGRESVPRYDQTPSGRYYQRGTIDYQKWDLSACFE